MKNHAPHAVSSIAAPRTHSGAWRPTDRGNAANHPATATPKSRGSSVARLTPSRRATTQAFAKRNAMNAKGLNTTRSPMGRMTHMSWDMTATVNSAVITRKRKKNAFLNCRGSLW